MNRMITFLILSLSLIGCNKKKENKDYIYYLKEVEYETIKELEKQGLHIAGVGGRAMNCISLVYLSFNYNKPADINKLRQLIILASETLLEKINNHEKIRPDLCTYPFTVENVEINILFTNNKKANKNNEVKNITFVTLKKGIIKYKYSKPKSYIIETLMQESYKEAKKKYKVL